MLRLFALCLLFVSSAHAQTLELRFLDVGQGDAILIREGTKTALIDAGSGSRIADYLNALGVDTIDLLVASHNHADHIGGMVAVFGSAVVRFYLDNGVEHQTSTYHQTIAAVRRSGAQYLQATPRTLTLGEAKVRVLGAPPGETGHNNSSVGLIVEYGAFKALLTGDSETLELTHWLTSGVVPRVQVVKVAHHGSSNGTTPEWIEATSPGAAIISVGTGNTYGHPSPAVVDAWQAAGAQVYRTDVDGTVIVTASQDGNFSVTRAIAPAGGPAIAPQVSAPSCCRVCTTGKACGDLCINRQYQCHKPPGCACNAKP